MKNLLSIAVALFLITSTAYAECSSCEGCKVSMEGSATIVTVASKAGNFETLLKAATAAGLVDTLNAEGPYTVFAPTDEAFSKIPKETLDALLKDPKALSKVLLYHVVPGNLAATDVLAKKSLTSAEGSKIQVSMSNGKAKVGDATITATDIKASNGVIHVIDTVLLPPSDSK